VGERPGSEREDAEERLFVESLGEGGGGAETGEGARDSGSDRSFWVGHRGLGSSQKAEVAWLEKQGYPYIQREVRSFNIQRAISAQMRELEYEVKHIERQTAENPVPFSEIGVAIGIGGA
jgi:hypothetical protein